MVFAILGLTPSLRWIPEVPLLLVSVLVPIAILTVAGYRAARASGRILPGAFSGALAGGIGGAAGGVGFVVYGKPALNIPIGLVAGIAGGLLWGALGAIAARRAR